jgi:hypothetical protein
MTLWRPRVLALDYGKLEGSHSFVHWSYGPLTISHDMVFYPGVYTKGMSLALCVDPNHKSTFMELEEGGLHGPS